MTTRSDFKDILALTGLAAAVCLLASPLFRRRAGGRAATQYPAQPTDTRAAYMRAPVVERVLVEETVPQSFPNEIYEQFDTRLENIFSVNPEMVITNYECDD